MKEREMTPVTRPEGRALRAPRAEAARLTAACALGTFGFGVANLVGWTFGIDGMQRLGLGTIHMLPITAVTFVLASVSLWMQRVTAREIGYQSLLVRALAPLVLLSGMLALVHRE